MKYEYRLFEVKYEYLGAYQHRLLVRVDRKRWVDINEIGTDGWDIICIYAWGVYLALAKREIKL